MSLMSYVLFNSTVVISQLPRQVLSVTMVIRPYKLSEQGEITKRVTSIKEMARMDVLYSDKTLNRLTVDKLSLRSVFTTNFKLSYFKSLKFSFRFILYR